MDQSFNIKYRIVHVDVKNHNIVIRYWTDDLSEDKLATEYELDSTNAWQIKRNDDGTPTRCQTDYNITMWNENPTEDDIKTIAQRYAPVDWFRVMNREPNHRLKDFHKYEGSFEHIPPKPLEMLNDDEVKQVIENLT